jgi:hypothetical protein
VKEEKMLITPPRAFLALLLLLCPIASADTITATWPDGLGYHIKVSYDNDGAGANSPWVSTIPVGMYFWDPVAGSNNPYPFNSRFLSFCIDLDQAAQTTQTFTLKSLEQAPESNGPGAYGSGTSSTFMTSAQIDLLRELYGEQYGNLLLGTETQQNDKTAAFALAIWEILFEQSATKSISNGYMKVLYTGGTPTYLTLANQYLTSTYDAGYSAYDTRLKALVSTNGQDQIVLVPLPKAFVAGLVLIGAVWLRKRRGASVESCAA